MEGDEQCLLLHWKEFFEKAEIEEPHASEYVDIFIRNCILPTSVSELREDHLTKMGITLLGHQLAIIKCVKEVEKKLEEDAINDTLKKFGDLEKQWSEFHKDFHTCKKILATLRNRESAKAMKIASDNLSDEQLDDVFACEGMSRSEIRQLKREIDF